MNSIHAAARRGIVFFEYLGFRAFVLALVPIFARSLKNGRRGPVCYAFDGSPFCLISSRVLGRMAGVDVRLFDFRLSDVHIPGGLSTRLYVMFIDLREVFRRIGDDTVFRKFSDIVGTDEYCRRYLLKSLVYFENTGPLVHRQLRHVLLLARIAAWAVEREGLSGAQLSLVVYDRPWLRVVKDQLIALNITWVTVRQLPDIRPAVVFAAKQCWRYWRRMKRVLFLFRPRLSSVPPQGRPFFLGVEYYGQFNLDSPAKFSDLFFWQCSDFPAKLIKIIFALFQDPLDKKKMEILDRYGISAVVRSPRATRLPENVAPMVISWADKSRGTRLEHISGKAAGRELYRHYVRFEGERKGWMKFLEQTGIRLYTHWFKYDQAHIPLAAALRDIGGIMTLYQRSYECGSAPVTALVADVFFAFSKSIQKVETGSGSYVPYGVVTGYMGDHRARLLRSRAAEIRETLLRSGVERIIAFFDENTSNEYRWFIGHHFTVENYGELLRRVLADQRIGLVLKPKSARTLLVRLGAVAKLLDELIKDGRCMVISDNLWQNGHPPIEAGLAADVVIHEHLSAGTAAMECALVGVPSLLLDREGWVCSLSDMGKDRVVFREWEALWSACEEHFWRPGGRPGFGDWSSKLDELDPFRDGRAAERMGTYLKWLLEGLNAGLPRETVLADAAQRYALRWGKDKIFAVNG